MELPIVRCGSPAVRRFFASLTIAMLLAHSALGCCWHHGHGCLAGCEAMANGHAAVELAELLAQGADPTHDEAGHQHRGPHECQGGRCAALRPANEGLTTLGSCVCLIVPSVLPQADAALSGDRAGWRLAGNPMPPPSLRLHLVNQVLTI
jgi:hypothetical protein